MTIEEQRRHWEFCLVNRDMTIMEILKLLSDTQLQIAIVVDNDRCLQGIICDGDIRRAILKGISLESKISNENVINCDPICVDKTLSSKDMKKVFEDAQVTRLPILSPSRQVVGLAFLEDYLSERHKENSVVIMAGGKGKRLQPLTDNIPKPMLPIYERPLLEIIIENFKRHGFSNFYISLNYLGEVIKSHFGDGDSLDVNISYIEEDVPLGTAGALKLMPSQSEPVIVTNGDILTKLDFSNLLDHHIEKKAAGTMCVKEYEYKIPYGVIKTKGDFISGVEEKPTHRFFVNAGIYVISPELINSIPQEKHYDITNLFSSTVDNCELPTSVFPVHEYWLDIGQKNDYEKAQHDYQMLFR